MSRRLLHFPIGIMHCEKHLKERTTTGSWKQLRHFQNTYKIYGFHCYSNLLRKLYLSVPYSLYQHSQIHGCVWVSLLLKSIEEIALVYNIFSISTFVTLLFDKIIMETILYLCPASLEVFDGNYGCRTKGATFNA